MCFCSLAWGRGAGTRVGGGEQTRGWGEGSGHTGAGVRCRGQGGPHPPCQLSGTGRPCPHQQVEGQLGLLETVHKLSLRGGPCPQREDALWTGRGGREPGRPAVAVPGGSGLSLRLPTGSAHLPRSGVTLPPAPAPPRTCRPLLPLLLSLLALVQLLEGLRRFLQPRHEPLNVVQSAVEDLLGPEWGRGQPQAARPSAGTPPPAASWPPGRGRGPECLGRPVRDPPSPSRSSAPARPAAPPPATRGGGGLHRAELQLTGPPPPAPLPPPAPPRGAHLALPAASAGPLGSWWKGSPRRSAGWGWGPGPGPRAGSTAAAGSSPGGP